MKKIIWTILTCSFFYSSSCAFSLLKPRENKKSNQFIFTTTKQDTFKVENCLDIALKHRLKGDFQLAIETLQQGISTVHLEAEKTQELAQLKLALAKTLLRQSFHTNTVSEAAALLYQEVYDMVIRTQDDALLADVFYGIGYYSFKKGREHWGEALRQLGEALAIETSLNDSLGMSQVQYTIGVIHQRSGEAEKAEKLFRTSLKLAQAISSTFMEGENERHLGYIHYMKGDWETAMPYFLRSLELRRSLDYTDGAIFAAITVGQNLEKQEQLTEAIPYLEEALVDAIQINSGVGKTRCYWTLGNIYKKMGQLKKAKSHLQKAIVEGELVNYNDTAKQAKELLKEME